MCAGEVDVSQFADPGLYPAWALDPLTVSHNPARFAKCAMSAAMLSNDQVFIIYMYIYTCIHVYMYTVESLCLDGCPQTYFFYSPTVVFFIGRRLGADFV